MSEERESFLTNVEPYILRERVTIEVRALESFDAYIRRCLTAARELSREVLAAFDGRPFVLSPVMSEEQAEAQWSADPSSR